MVQNGKGIWRKGRNSGLSGLVLQDAQMSNGQSMMQIEIMWFVPRSGTQVVV